MLEAFPLNQKQNSTDSIQHFIGGSSQCNKNKKKQKVKELKKEKNPKWSLFKVIIHR